MINSTIGISHFLILSLILFSIGIFGIIISNNLIKIMLSCIIIINAVCINFIAISQYSDGLKLEGSTFEIFISVINLIVLIIFISLILNNKDKLKG